MTWRRFLNGVGYSTTTTAEDGEEGRVLKAGKRLNALKKTVWHPAVRGIANCENCDTTKKSDKIVEQSAVKAFNYIVGGSTKFEKGKTKKFQPGYLSLLYVRSVIAA